MIVAGDADIEALRRIGGIVARVTQAMLDALEPGMTTRELDALGAGRAFRTAARLRLPRRHLHQHQRGGRARHSRRPRDPGG
jgi:hypothetical protein